MELHIGVPCIQGRFKAKKS